MVGAAPPPGWRDGRVLVPRRGLHRLVVDAGVGHHHAQLHEGRDGALFQRKHRRGLAEERGVGEVGAAGVGDRRNAHVAAAFLCRGEAFQPAHAGLAEALGVGHDVGLGHGDEVFRAEDLADLDLVLEREPGHRAELSGEDAALFLAQPHGARIVARKPRPGWRSVVDRSRFCESSWRRPLMRIAIWLAALSLVAWSAGALAQPELAALASVSGTVSSPAPFKAAKVYFRNTERRMQYMVYTAGGKYQAMHLQPGNYEMRVAAPGLASAIN